MAKLWIVGTGPGDSDYIAPRVRQVILDSELVVGYRPYLSRISELISGKETYGSGMRSEIDRARYALEGFRSGRKVSLVSGGDAGIYGMAGLVLELLSDGECNSRDVEIIPGITAASAAGAVVGAPLTNDFCAVSLSDYLTPREVIRLRLRHAAEGDFVTVLYNARSTKREDLFKEALELFNRQRGPDCPAAVVTNAFRPEQSSLVLPVNELLVRVDEVAMQSTVIIGNSETYLRGRWLITPRGYAAAKNKEPQ